MEIKSKNEESFGTIPFCKIEGILNYLLIKHKNGHWGFPKGHADTHEKNIDTAKRETFEETGLNVDIIKNCSFQETYTYNFNHENVTKTVTYYLGKTNNKNVKINDTDEIEEYIWAEYSFALSLLEFASVKKIISNAHLILLEKNDL